mgnify:CR=1 FL=1
MSASLLSQNSALSGLLDKYLTSLAEEEQLAPQTIVDALEAGTMVLLGNPAHPNLKPLLVGQPARIKVNANIGTSPLCNCPATEERKIKAALEAGADTVMDLSIAGDLDALRLGMLKACPLPLGTVPLYAVGQQILDAEEDIATMQPDALFDEIAKQAEQGVDFITVHCGLSKRGAEMAVKNNRVLGIVSRGGSMLARWMLENNRENPLLEYFDRLLDICRPYNVTLSLGDGLRPGAGVDAGDAAQWEEVINLGQLAKYALERGVQCMIEGPGHVPYNQIAANMQLQKRLCHGAPFYVLGPLVTDVAPGYDHITSAIGGTLAAVSGANFLCYVTPAEHLGLPDLNDVREGVIATRIAAHAADVANGNKQAWEWDLQMARARKVLDWPAQLDLAIDPVKAKEYRRRKNKSDDEACSMCGDYCAVKIVGQYLEEHMRKH